MLKKIFLFCLIFFICLISLAQAAPPVPGGEVTSPFGPRNGDDFGGSNYHKGVDIGTQSGTPIIAPGNGTVTHGAGNGYIYWVDIQLDNGEYFLFGDCSPDTLSCPTGYITEGTLIGYTGGDAYSGPLGTSTGAHVHIEYSPSGEFGGRIDPVPALLSLGVDLSGNITGGGRRGYDNVMLPWGIEGMYQLGDTIEKSMKTIVEATKKGFEILQNASYILLVIICTIDLALPLIMSMNISLNFAVGKIIKYGFLFFIFTHWQDIIDDFLLSFISSVSTTFTQDTNLLNSVSEPQMILQKAIYMVTPALNKIASFGSWDFYMNIATIIPIYLMTFLTIGIFFFLACYIMIVYVEFYISATFSIVTFPFTAWGLSKFISEGTLGHLISSTLKLTIISILVGFCVICIKDAEPGDIFTVTTPATQASGTGVVSGPADLVALATQKAQKYGMPVNLFLGQIQTESNWNPNAESEAGAQGLGQLMPETAAGLGCSDPFDPEQNLEASAKYMKQLYDMYGDWNYALAAYNYGPGAITAGEPLPQGAQDYINKVNGNISGSYTVNNGITAEAMSKFLLMCLSLIGLAFFIIRIPKALMDKLGGRFEIS